MVNNIKDIGKIIKCMEKVFLDGQMGVFMKGNMLTTKKMDLVGYNGLMVRYIKASGNQVFNMVKENIKVKMVYGNKDIGRTAKELNELFTNKNDLIYFLNAGIYILIIT